MTLTDQIASIREQLQVAAASASQKIFAGNDNPSIKRVSAQSFTMSSSDLGKSMVLSPFYHDWKSQYEFIADLVTDGKFHDVKTLLEKGSLKNSQENRVFAPEVIEHVKSIVGGLNFSLDDSESEENKKSIRAPRFR